MIRLATWNINSLRIRGEILSRFIEQMRPDVLCLQETKVEDALFPHDLVAALGFPHVVFSGQKSYNGVAILSKLPLHEMHCMDVIGNAEKRHISARLDSGIRLHNFYVPAGGDLPDAQLNPKFADKLRFVDAMRDWSALIAQKDEPVLAMGDFNIAPHPNDVWSHKQLLDVVSHTPIEVEKFTAAQNAGKWIDVARQFVPETEKLYSWWSYRNRDYAASNRGRRLDHIWASPALTSRCIASHITSETRAWESPSDHVPVLVDIV